MKPKFYTLLCALCLVGFTILSSSDLYSQCNCTGGVPANQEHYTASFGPTTSSNIVISFPKFSGAGAREIYCIRLYDTITVESTTMIRNMDPIDPHSPDSRLTLVRNITGTGLSTSNVLDKSYGPDLLQPLGTHGDSIVYGPELTINSVTGVRSISNSSRPDYYGASGTVNFTFAISGGAIPLSDGTNYVFRVGTITTGKFGITYFWCPSSVLSRSIQNFSAFKKEEAVKLSWTGINETESTSYTVEVSNDGKNFETYTSFYKTDGRSSTYSLNFPVNNPNVGERLYFRIVQVEAGKKEYSDVKLVNIKESLGLTLTTYPNPATSQVRLDFDRAIKGDVEVELINTLGQRVFAKQYALKNQPSLQVDLSVKPAPGLYYLRATDKATRQQYSTRLLIK